MNKQLRILLGSMIITIMLASAVSVGVLLPIRSINLTDEVEKRLIANTIVSEDMLKPYTGADSDYSDWMYTGKDDEAGNFTVQTKFEFYNVSDRASYLYFGQPVPYLYVQGAMYFDVITNKTVVEYRPDLDTIVYGTKKEYVYNAELSTLTGNEKIMNYNYLWPYYIKHFGNGTESGFQAYMAAYLIKENLDRFKVDDPTLTDVDLA